MPSSYSRLALALAIAGATPLLAQPADSPGPITAARDGQRDFDWEIGTWETRVRVLRNPLSGQPPQWAEYLGTSVVKPLLDGRANFVELAVAGETGRIEGGSLRLYNPQTRQWSLNYSSLGSATLSAPVFGGFDGRGHGLFYGQDVIGGRVALVRFVVTPVSRSEARFEQAYSVDAGTTWEVNWVAVDTRR